MYILGVYVCKLMLDLQCTRICAEIRVLERPSQNLSGAALSKDEVHKQQSPAFFRRNTPCRGMQGRQTAMLHALYSTAAFPLVGE